MLKKGCNEYSFTLYVFFRSAENRPESKTLLVISWGAMVRTRFGEVIFADDRPTFSSIFFRRERSRQPDIARNVFLWNQIHDLVDKLIQRQARRLVPTRIAKSLAKRFVRGLRTNRFAKLLARYLHSPNLDDVPY